MSQDITATSPSQAPVLWEPPKTETARQELQSVLLNSTFPGARPEMVGEVISYCAARQIDPLLKPVHIVPMWNSKERKMIDTIMPGIYLYRILAARTGEYAGKTYPEWGPVRRENLGGQNVAYPEWCRMKVFRRINGTTCEFGAEEWWLENYATRGRDSAAPNHMWAKRSRGQLAKCVEAQALRMAFPEAFGGTMTLEEMEGKMDAPKAQGQVIDAESETQEAPHQPLEQEKPKGGLSEEGMKRLEEGTTALTRRIISAKSTNDLKVITSDPAVQKQRAFLRENAPKLADKVDRATKDAVEILEREEQKNAQEAPSGDVEMPA